MGDEACQKQFARSEEAGESEQEEEEELEDLPPEQKENDRLLGAVIRKGPFNGEVVDIERGTSSKEVLYQVRYADNDLEHFTREQVLQYSMDVVAKRRRYEK